jgi:hypothetical protein
VRKKPWQSAIHEAGHAVVGLALGYEVVEVVARRNGTGWTRFAGRPLPIPVGDRGGARDVRHDLVVDVAGPVAEYLYREADRWGRWLTPGERIAHAVAGLRPSRLVGWTEADFARHVCPHGVSSELRRGSIDDPPAGDVSNASRKGEALMLYRWDQKRLAALKAAGVAVDDLRRHPPLPPPSREQILTQVMRAEQWAERLLRQEQPALETIAEALSRQGDGRLTGPEVERLLRGVGPHPRKSTVATRTPIDEGATQVGPQGAGLSRRGFPPGPTAVAAVNAPGLDPSGVTGPDYTPQARRIATCFNRDHFSTHRGVRLLPRGARGLPDGCWLAVFGNDGYDQDWRVRAEVALVRAVLAAFDVQEYGFGVDAVDGYSWALLVGRAQVRPLNRRALGRQKRHLRARLEDVVRWAWSAATGSAATPRRR